MIFNAISFIIFVTLTTISKVHGIGLWIVLIITHGIFYDLIGQGTEHMPLFGGLAVFAVVLIRQKWSGVSPDLFFMILAIVLAMAFSGLLGIQQDVSLITLMLYMKGFLLLVLLAGCLNTEKEIELITLYWLFALTVGGIFTIYQFKTGSMTINTMYDKRAAGLRGDPNDTAMLLVAGIPLAFYWFTKSTKLIMKAVFVISIVFIMTGMVLTESRGGFVTLLFIMLIYLIKRPSIKLFFLGFLLLMGLAALSPQSYMDRMATLFTGREEFQSHSLKKRATLQKIGLEIFMANPFIGVGPGNFSKAFMEKYRPGQFVNTSLNTKGTKTFAVAHNMYLEFFVENGLLGGSLFLLLLYKSLQGIVGFAKLRNTTDNNLGLGFSIVLSNSGMLFAGLFLSQAKNSVLWAGLGIGFAISAIASREIKNNVDSNKTNSDNVIT